MDKRRTQLREMEEKKKEKARLAKLKDDVAQASLEKEYVTDDYRENREEKGRENREKGREREAEMYVLLYARLYMCGDVYVNVSLRLLLVLLLTLLPIILLTPFLTPLLSLLLPRYGPMVAEVLNELTDGGAGPLTRLARAMGWGRGRRKKLEEEAYERSVINKQTKSVGYVFIYQLLTLTRPPSAMPLEPSELA